MDIDFLVEGTTIKIECYDEQKAKVVMSLIHKLFLSVPGTKELGAVYEHKITGDVEKTGVFKDELQN